SSPKIGLNNITISSVSGGLPTPKIQLVDPTNTIRHCGDYTIDFGTLGSDFGIKDFNIYLQNIGLADLEVDSMDITGDYSITSPAFPFSITPGNAQAVTLQFVPTDIGARTGVLTINNNDLDKNPCFVNLTGIGVIPEPEIRVETNAGGNIPNNSPIAPIFDNTFAQITEGTTSAPKTYLILNLGTGNLDLSSIALSTTEFTFVSNPAPIILAPGESVPVLVAFSPSTPGIKNANITINNNDSDEGVFTFALIGTALCGSNTITATPNFGAENTVITITDLTTNISTASVTLNGNPLTTTIINSNQIEVSIPNWAQTGHLRITNAAGCLSSFPFTMIDNRIGGCEGSSVLSEIFISELTDATFGGLSYIELYNATGAPVDLSNYSIAVYQNGNTNPLDHTRYRSANLSGTIGINQTFVIAIGNDRSDCPDGGDGLLANLIINSFGGINKRTNEHDYIGLYRSGILIDEFGIFGSNNWMDNLHTEISGDRGFDFRRLKTATTLPNDTFDDNEWLIIDWPGSGLISCEFNDYSDIGLYDFSTGIPPIITVQPTLPTFTCNLSTSINLLAEEGYPGGATLTYQWYVSTPGGSGWTEITNGPNYSGVQSNTLNILNALNFNNYQYYCQVREDSATCYTASETVRLKIHVAIWDGTNWTNNTPPDIDTIAIIRGNYSTGTDISFSACQLYVDPTFVLTISDNTYVEVQNTIELGGEIHLETAGSLVQVNDSGIMTLTNPNAINSLTKNTHHLQNWYDYTYWSSPLENAQIENALSQAKANRRFLFRADLFEDLLIETDNTGTFTSGQDDIDDHGNDWFNQQTGAMVPGVGYAATHNNTGFTPGVKQYTFEGTLASGGAFNNGDITLPIYVNQNLILAPYNNWNFIGNPYPSAIDANAFFNHTASFLEGVIYFWSHYTNPDPTAPGNQGENFSKNDYAMYNYVGGVGTGPISNNDPSRIPNGYIASGQGFFVIANKTFGTTPGFYNHTVFNNAMRVGDNNEQFFRTATNNNKIWVNLTSDNGAFNQVLIGYIIGATDGVDGMHFDALRNLSAGTNVFLYSLISDSDKKFAIQAKDPNNLHLEEVIPLGFRTSIDIATVYKLSIEQFEGPFFDENAVYLKDNFLQLVHNLSTSDYTFSSEVGEFNNRFELVFTNSVLSINEGVVTSGQVSIIELQNGEVQFRVPNLYEIKSIEIMDLLGRTIYKLKGESSIETYNLSNLSRATYIAKITLSTGQVLIKKGVKRK
ncbi:MAG: choice-of-anchor D domain-containing protein, partial [Xanthomarina sp.]